MQSHADNVLSCLQGFTVVLTEQTVSIYASYLASIRELDDEGQQCGVHAVSVVAKKKMYVSILRQSV